MPEAKLEKVMIDFVDGRYDILCCTAIIESGLDIPRANTMIVHQADRFGLAQLYQLRGRIGRARERAFCYLVIPAEQGMTAEAEQRLAVLQRLTELGAGLQIATSDLEIAAPASFWAPGSQGWSPRWASTPTPEFWRRR